MATEGREKLDEPETAGDRCSEIVGGELSGVGGEGSREGDDGGEEDGREMHKDVVMLINRTAYLMESFSFPQFPAKVHVALYTNVGNAIALRKRIISAAAAQGEDGEREREALNFAFISARPVGQIDGLIVSLPSLTALR